MTLDSSPPSVREGQLRSAFTSILEALCESCVGALAAGLVDDEGECVDLASLPGAKRDLEPPSSAAPPLSSSPRAGNGESESVPSSRGFLGGAADGGKHMPGYSIKLSGAHWQIVMRQAAGSAELVRRHGSVRQLWVQTERFSYVVGLLHAGYVLALICEPDALAAVSPRALRQVEVELALEAGWPVPEPERPFWRRVRVRLDERGRPRALRYARSLDGGTPAWESSLAGVTALASVSGFERGFVIALRTHETLTLVREPSGFWYAASQSALARRHDPV